MMIGEKEGGRDDDYLEKIYFLKQIDKHIL